jgi:hypothetical protein
MMTRPKIDSAQSDCLLILRRYIRRVKDSVGFNVGLTRVLKFSTTFIVVAHLMGCALFYVGTFGSTSATTGRTRSWLTETLFLQDGVYAQVGDLGVGDQYLVSIYWAITTMVTVGFGDIHPATISGHPPLYSLTRLQRLRSVW